MKDQIHRRTYDGSPLKWLEWVDNFRAMVHDTQMHPAEKFGLLKLSLRERCTLSVSGIGDGEDAYREGFRRLKINCGSIID